MFNPSGEETAEGKRMLDGAASIRIFDDVADPLGGGTAVTSLLALALYCSGDHDLKERDGEIHRVRLNGRMPMRFEIIPGS